MTFNDAFSAMLAQPDDVLRLAALGQFLDASESPLQRALGQCVLHTLEGKAGDPGQYDRETRRWIWNVCAQVMRFYANTAAGNVFGTVAAIVYQQDNAAYDGGSVVQFLTGDLALATTQQRGIP